MARFDYIVVGSGSGGAAVTRRLVEAGADVALVEAGPMGFGVDALADPAGWVALTKGPFDWGHDHAPDPNLLDRVVPAPRGRVLGGSSAINAQMWYRGHPADYDRWARTCPGWSWAECLPFFRRCEDWEGGGSTLRGAGGPLRITRPPQPHPLATAAIAAASEMGLPVLSDPNGPSNEGAALSNLNIRSGRRHDAAEGYLRPILSHPRLTLFVGSLATRLILTGDRATGLRHRVAGAEIESMATQGIILAAGAFGTPRLLMLSGLGPEGELARLGLPCHLPLPELGENLQDHPLIRAVNARARAPLGPVTDNGGGAILNWRSDPALDQPDLHAFPVQGRSATPAVLEAHDLTGDLFAIGCGLMRSRSRGRMRVLAPDPEGPLHLEAGFLSDPRDMAALRACVLWVQEMLERPALSPLFAGHAAPATRLREGPELDLFLRRACSTFFHSCGTARMGEDDRAPVTPRLGLRGMRGIWVADASVIPEIPTCNTHAPVTMIGERAARFILEDA